LRIDQIFSVFGREYDHRHLDGAGSDWFAGTATHHIQYGGPGKAVFEASDAIPVTNGQTSTTVRFSQPGTYRLRAIANDGELSTTADVVVTVK